MKELIEELQSLQNEVFNIVSAASDINYQKQFHPDLSPLGWHLGHCVYTESYWIREQLLGQQANDNALKSLYVPELSHKPSRGSSLQDKASLLSWAKKKQVESTTLLETEIHKQNPHHLLENNFLIHFLIQHYSQHIETMRMVLTEMHLQQSDAAFNIEKKLTPCKTKKNTQSIAVENYDIGSNQKDQSYDNERPAHSVKLKHFNISTMPVSNGEYLQFIHDNAYDDEKNWSAEGWLWIKKTKHKHPHHWRMKDNSLYYGIDIDGTYILEDHDPVHGLSYYEAEAFAIWQGGRLPHEHEWEVAYLKGYLESRSLAWEWCNNTFYPYSGFTAYPYEGYSIPYFDGKHYVLKGGSKFSKDCIKRASFRNYYTADKRHIFAGLRLVYD